MWKFNVPEWERKYLYFLLAALGLVLIFSWGQLRFYDQSERASVFVSSGQNYPVESGSWTGGESGRPGTGRKVNGGIFGGIKRNFTRYRAIYTIERLKRRMETTEDDTEQARLDVALGDYYAYELGDEEQAFYYYNKAAELGGKEVLTLSRRNTGGKSYTVPGTSFFSIGAVFASIRYYFSNAQPYDLRSSVWQIGETAAERIMIMARTAEPPERVPVSSRTEKSVSSKPKSDDLSDRVAGADPLDELSNIMSRVVIILGKDRPRELLPLISVSGLRSGRNVAESETYSYKEIEEQFRHRKGEVYSALFDTIKKSRIKAGQISYTLTYDQPLCFVELAYPNNAPQSQQRRQRLYFQQGEDKWQIVFVGW